MVKCFRSMTPTDLIEAMGSLYVFLGLIPLKMFGPTIEKGTNPFISDHPYKLIKEGKVHDVPLMLSNVNDEGIYPVGGKVSYGFDMKLDKHSF